MMDAKNKEIVIKAIDNLGRRVSVADIATKTGLPITTASFTLNQVAAETGGHLQVTDRGDIAYLFPIGYQARYISKGISNLIEQLSKKIFEFSFFLLRISFGVMLLLSLLTIVIIFFIVIFATSRSRDDDNFDFDINFFDWAIFRELIFWQINSPGIVTPRGNFFYNCFSFLFGDGNPNPNLEERRWQNIGQLIRENHGAIVAEQLAPFTGADASNEDNVLPVLVRFDGIPNVSESGNIVYLFPSLQATATQDKSVDLTPYFRLSTWKFSKVSIDELTWVMGLAALNFFGSLWLYLHTMHITLSFLSSISLALLIYGALFVFVPIVRYGIIQILNKHIEKKNKLKQEYAAKLEKPDPKLKKKLQEAHKMALDNREIKTENLIYNTQTDLLEQEFPAISNS